MKKRILSLTMALCLCITLFPTFTNASTNHSQSEAVSWIQARKNEGWAEDYDGVYGAQCVDLIKYYFDYLVGYSLSGYGYDYVGRDDLPNGWTYQSSPSSGDIAVWGAWQGFAREYGHVALVESVGSGSFSYVDINGATGVGGSGTISNSNASTFIHPDFGPATPPVETTPYTDKVAYSLGSNVTIHWDSVYNATDYFINIYTWTDSYSNAIQLVSTGVGSNTSYSLLSPKQGNYRVYVEAINNIGTSKAAYCEFSVGTPSEAQPYTDKSTYNKDSNITIKWNSVENVTTYYINVYTWTDSYDNRSKLTEASLGKVTSYTLSKAKPGNYRVYIEALNDAGASRAVSCDFTVLDDVSISLDRSTLSLNAGSSITISATVSPAGTSVNWSSSNPSVATVSGGKVTAVSAGSATITASAGGKSATCSVTVSEATVAVTGVTLSQNSLTLKPGGSASLTATISPTNATDKAVTWSSSNPSVATVSGGKVTAVGAGSATITASAGGKSMTCAVTVSENVIAVQSVTLDKTALSLTEGETGTLTATVKPDNATGKSVSWTSNDASIAAVSGGKVTAIKAGTATITASCGNVSATCSVTVKEKRAAPTITTLNAISGAVESGYQYSLTAIGAAPITWRVSSGALPDGLSLNSSTGAISGTPTKAGTFSFTVSAKNNIGETSKTFSILIAEKGTQTTENDVHFEKATIYFQDQFSDVPANQWYTDSVASAYELGLMKGNSDSTFNPYGDVTIAEAITMAARIHSIYTTGSESFQQSSDKWYQVYLDYALENGIINRAYYNSDVTQKASRAQFAEIFANSLPSEALGAVNSVADNSIPDVSMTAGFAGYVYKLYRAGILTGSDANGTFNPQTYITRAEAAAIVSRMAESNNRVSIKLG